MKWLKALVVIFLSLIAAQLLLPPSPNADDQGKKPLVVFTVRHGEKVQYVKDPGLTEAGLKRAKALADQFQNDPLDYIHSTKFKRTRQTAEPAAKKFGLTVNLYDPGDLPGLVEKMKKSGGRHLVVGHSNTTPELVRLLGGNPGDPIDEKNEYDRLYIITISPDDKANTVLMRYGTPSIFKKKKPDIETCLTEGA